MVFNSLAGEALTKKVAERMATEDFEKLIQSEIVASATGEKLTNEKFLQKYAQKDECFLMTKKKGVSCQ